MTDVTHRFLRVEDGYCAYDQHRLQPVAVFAVDDRRGEVSLSGDCVRNRIANKEAQRAAATRYNLEQLPSNDIAEELAAIEALEALVVSASPSCPR